MILAKILPYLAALILIALSYVYVHHRGVVTGKADIQVQFDAFVKKQQALATQAHIDAVAKDVAARKENAKALANYQRQMGLSHAYSDYLVSRLRPYLDASRSGVPQGQDRLSAPNPGQTSGTTGIGERIGDALAECRLNDAQLDALREELIPQL